MSWVITLDGGSGSGKTDLAIGLAQRMGAQALSSGLMYRTYAYARRMGESSLPRHLSDVWSMDCSCDPWRVFWSGVDITEALLDESMASEASRYALDPEVRAWVTDTLRTWPRASGLIVEGRDMGTVVFPDAVLKWFVHCPLEIRAERRCAQLLAHGIHVNFSNVLEEMRLRDQRDEQRSLAPLICPKDAKLIENIGSRSEVLDKMFRMASEHIGAYFKK